MRQQVAQKIAPKRETPLAEESRDILESGLAGYLALYSDEKPYLPEEIFAICPPRSFKNPQCRAVAETIQELAFKKQPMALPDIGMALNASGKLKLWGGNVVLVDFAAQAGRIAGDISAERWAHMLATANRREAAALLASTVVLDLQVFGGVPADVAADRLRKIAAELDEGAIVKPAASLDDQLEAYAQEIDSPQALPVKSPWRKVNAILRGGILPGELGVLAARPGTGKSALALNWAYSVACSGLQTLFFSLEMPLRQILDRLMSNLGNINAGSFREGLSAREKEKVREAVGKAYGKPLMVIDQTKITVSEIRRRVKIAQQSGQVGLVVVDYLQLMEPEMRLNSREREVAEMSRGLKLLAKELSVPVLLLAQLNRKSEEAKREPHLSDLRESGAIEQDADIVIFLHQARLAWHPDEPVQLIVAKGRSSGVGRESLIFLRLVQRFEESTDAAWKKAQGEEQASWGAPELE